MFKIIILSGILLQLISCSTINSSASNNQNSTNGTQVANISDAEIKITLNNKLSHDILNSNIEVSVHNHVVLLTGQVPNLGNKNTAETITKQQLGVSTIYNYLEIAPNITPEQNLADMVITSKTKTKILLEKGLPSTDITVITSNKVVYLMGTVTHYIGNQTSQVANRIPDARKIITVFEYIEE